MKTYEEIREQLARSFSKEKKRLKTFKTKPNSFDYANVIARYVQSYMSAARASQLRRFRKWYKKHQKANRSEILNYINTEERGIRKMSEAILHVADDNDSKRPWRHDKKKNK